MAAILTSRRQIKEQLWKRIGRGAFQLHAPTSYALREEMEGVRHASTRALELTLLHVLRGY